MTTKSKKLAVTGWVWKGRTARAKNRKMLLSLPWRKTGAFYGPVEYFSLSPAFFHIGWLAPMEPPDFVCMPSIEPPWVRHNLNEVDYLQKASLRCLMLQGRGGGGKMLSACVHASLLLLSCRFVLSLLIVIAVNRCGRMMELKDGFQSTRATCLTPLRTCGARSGLCTKLLKHAITFLSFSFLCESNLLMSSTLTANTDQSCCTLCRTFHRNIRRSQTKKRTTRRSQQKDCYFIRPPVFPFLRLFSPLPALHNRVRFLRIFILCVCTPAACSGSCLRTESSARI